MIHLFLLLFNVVLCSPAFSAQQAIISVEKANVYQNPSLNSPIITTVEPGESVVVSNTHKEGWYRIQIKSGKRGWIWQANIAILQNDPHVKAGELEMSGNISQLRSHHENFLFFTLEGFVFGIGSSDINTALGVKAYKLDITPGGFGEIALRLAEDIRLAIRGGFYRSTTTVKTASAGQYTVTHIGEPLLLGLQRDIKHFQAWDITIGLYGGMSLKNVLEVTAVGQPPLNYFRMQGSSYAFLLNVAAKYRFSNHVNAVFELNGYYTGNNPKTIPNNFNGSGPFLNANGSLSSLSIQHYGPLLATGLQFAF